jgi:hypothetical protein
MRCTVYIGVWFGLCSALGCKKVPEPTNTRPAPTAIQAVPALRSSAERPPPKADLPPVEITWQDPPSFRRVQPKSRMRKASYEVPRASGDTEDGDLAVFYFGPGEGGGVEANVERWIGQFSGVPKDKVRRADRQVNGLVAHTIEIDRGTFASGMPGMPGANAGPRKDYGMLGGIVEAPSGSYYFKLTGPTNTVKAAHDAFYKLVDSVRVAGS